jgi:hypothetical protein
MRSLLTSITLLGKAKGILLLAAILLSFSGISQSIRTAVQSGNWTTKGTWDCNCVPAATDNAVIESGTTVTFVADNTINHLTIKEGGVISDNGRNNTITGNFVVNGTYGGYGTINLTGNGASISGTGIISNTSVINITGDKEIPAGSELTKSSGDVNINGAFTVTNNGSITIGANIIGLATTSTWINGANSTLNIGGTSTTNPLLQTGTLNASAEGNTINYFGALQYTFKLPVSGTYYNLILSGSNNKTIPNATVIVDGDLTIYSTLNGNGTNKLLHVRGNWTNYGGFTPGAGSVTFDGTGDQIISNTSTEDFHNLTINKSSGKLILDANVVVASNVAAQANRSLLNMISGDIVVGSNNLTLGRISTDTLTIYTGILSYTDGKIIGPFKRFINHEWLSTRTYVINEIVFYNGDWWKSLTNSNTNNIPAEGARWTAHTGILFPVGVTEGDRSVNIYFKNITTGLLTVEFNPDYPGNIGLPKTDDAITIYNTFRDGYWSLTPQIDLESTEYNISLTGDGMESIFTIDEDTRILYRTNESSIWEFKGTHGTNVGSTVNRSAVNLLSGQFALGDKNNCMAPVAKSITGRTELCKGDSNEAYAITGDSENTYTWVVSGGQIDGGLGNGTDDDPSIITGSGLTSIVVDWGEIGGTASVSVTEGIYCEVPGVTLLGPENTLEVVLRPEIPATISGKISVPQNGTDAEPYSVASLPGYTYSWNATGGNIQQDPPSGSSISILWGASGTGNVNVITSYSGCSGTSMTSLSIRIYETITSVKSGNWALTDNSTNRSLWDCNCIPPSGANITIKNTHRVTISNANNPNTTITNLNIEQGGILVTGSNSGRPLIITGDLNVNGTLEGTASSVNLNAGSTNSFIYGTGLISNTSGFNINASRTIFSTAALSKPSGSITIAAGVKVRNDGSMTFGSDITGGDATSEWVNQEGSILEVGGTLLSTGILDASANNNLIRYNGTATQNIKIPSNSGQYNNIAFSGTGSKVLPSSGILINGNFTNDAPMSSSSGLVEFNGQTTISGSVAPLFNNLSISGELISSSDSIRLTGDLTKYDNGIFNHNFGTVSFEGGNSQNIDSKGADFYNVNVNKSGGNVTITTPLNLVSVLNVQSSSVVQSNGNLTLLSTSDDPDVTASIAPLLNGANVSGNVNIHRFVSDEGRFYRYISSPIANTNVSDWQDDFAITGNFIGRSIKDPYNNTNSICGTIIRPTSPSLYHYNESFDGVVDDGYETFPVMSTNLEVGRGYAAFIRETCYRNITIDVSGEVNKGSISLPVTFTTTSDPTADGWNLVGNPYPSAINWNNTNWTKNNISPVIAIRDNGTGMMRYYDGGGSANDFNGTITLGQAFWVRATDSNPSLVIHEGAKTYGESNVFYRIGTSTQTIPSISVSLTNGLSTDKAFIKLREDASAELDSWDATKLKNQQFGISTLTSSGISMAINAVPLVYEGYKFPLKLDDVEEGRYTLGFNANSGFEEYSVELTDHNLGVTKILNWGEEYSFTADYERLQQHRFEAKLVKQQNSEIQVLNIVAFPNPVKGELTLMLPPDGLPKQWVVYDQRGVPIERKIELPESEHAKINFSFKPSGVYLIRLTGQGYNVSTKLIKD